LTKAVLDISRGSGGEAYVETAVYSRREADSGPAGAPGFENTPDSDPALPANREWAHGIRARIETSTAGDATLRAAVVDDAAALDSTVAKVQAAASGWGSRPASERAEVLLRAAAALESRRGELIEAAASETGKILAEA